MTVKHDTVEAILDAYGRTFSDELRIHVERNSPSPLFKMLVFSMLSCKPISHSATASAAEALFEQGWTTAEKMAAVTWEQRVKVLNTNHYARYDESTSRMLAETCGLMLEKYKGDLRLLRSRAGRDPGRERELLKEFKGIGDVGVDIFFRETQSAWDELFPFADARTLKAAARLGLGGTAEDLARQVAKQDFPRLTAALVRIELEDAYEQFE